MKRQRTSLDDRVALFSYVPEALACHQTEDIGTSASAAKRPRRPVKAIGTGTEDTCMAYVPIVTVHSSSIANEASDNFQEKFSYVEERQMSAAPTPTAVVRHHSCKKDLQWFPPLEPFILPELEVCAYCHAKRFKFEPKGFCCANGAIMLVSNAAPQPLWDLFTDKIDISTEFRTRIRTYNNAFAFTSFGVKYDKNLCKNTQGIYTFKAQGQCYHFLSSLSPLHEHPRFFQLYFYDTEHEMRNRKNAFTGLNGSVISYLLDIVNNNPYARFFRTLREVPNLDECQIVIEANTTLDQRTFNVHTASQVAAIWVEPEDNRSQNRQIIVQGQPGNTYIINYYFGCYDPLQYPLLFPYGETGWHEGIRKSTHRVRHQNINEVDANEATSAGDLIDSETRVMEKGKRKRNTVSCREYYCFRLQIRSGTPSLLLLSGRLLQQYVIDMYIKLETSRLDYIKHNQSNIRAELYNGIVDSISSGETNATKVGKKIILPPSFIGGPRDMRRRYLDAMALVQRFGKPDIFLTMTCNPGWSEIKRELLSFEKAQDRPDLLARVFRAKLEELKKDLFTRNIFGHVAAHVYVIEFQKRGLPHAHFLFILQNQFKIRSPDMYDTFVCAEIPDENANPHLYNAVLKHMIHGPCGSYNLSNFCMKADGTCKNHYPRSFCEKTTRGIDSYPVYKRRNNNVTMEVRGHNIDNRWVVPYNSYLLAKYDCHLNVEICSTIKAVKYLYKYIYKGHDRVSFNVVSNSVAEINHNEIESFQSARWVSPPEAMWRIYKFDLNEISPPVLQLQLHLENKQSIAFNSTSDLNDIVQNSYMRKTTLTEYFRTNRDNVAARSLLYKDFPEHFVWHKNGKMWTPRKRGYCVGRIVSTSPLEGERYYLRLLLNHVAGALSFNDLKCRRGTHFTCFRDAALAYGLLEADNSLDLCLAEASTYVMPAALRRLFVSILVFCNPVNARNLWEKYLHHMQEDFTRLPSMTANMSLRKTMVDIAVQLESMGRDINDFHLVDSTFNLNEEISTGLREIEDELKIVVSHEDLESISKLNNDQRIAFDTINQCVFSDIPRSFFIDGPGGSGKTYLYRALLASLRSRGHIALATASSGIAASLFPGGRTAHSRFKIPLDIEDNQTCFISKQSGLGNLIRAAKLILWDEATMVRKRTIEVFNVMLQDICESSQNFGGKVVVFGGDFRQVLPVVSKATTDVTIDSSLVTSFLWPSFFKFSLVTNMRANLDPGFAKFLLSVGNGTVPINDEDHIRIPASMLIKDGEGDSLEELMHVTFPNIKEALYDTNNIVDRAILAPKNDFVDGLNDMLIRLFPGELKTYHSFDSATDASLHGLQEYFFNTLSPLGFPLHMLNLKLNCPVILLRNLDPSKGLCNGTRLICRAFGSNLIHAEIATGDHKGEMIFLPRIPLLPIASESVPYPFKRTQFPVRLCFAMTINKAQGQTLDFVGIYLPEPVFSHGQLYVALSRARTSSSVKILIRDSNSTNCKFTTKNVVYQKILRLARGLDS